MDTASLDRFVANSVLLCEAGREHVLARCDRNGPASLSNKSAEEKVTTLITWIHNTVSS